MAKELGHTFKIVEKYCGFLGLGARVAVLDENGTKLEEVVVYAPTLRKMETHTGAEVLYTTEVFYSGSDAPWLSKIHQRVVDTNSALPKRFQRPHPAPAVK